MVIRNKVARVLTGMVLLALSALSGCGLTATPDCSASGTIETVQEAARDLLGELDAEFIGVEVSVAEIATVGRDEDGDEYGCSANLEFADDGEVVSLPMKYVVTPGYVQLDPPNAFLAWIGTRDDPSLAEQMDQFQREVDEAAEKLGW